MDDVQTQPRVSDEHASEQTEENRSQEAPAAIVARMLANPRRVRRN